MITDLTQGHLIQIVSIAGNVLTLAAQVEADPKKENFGIEPLPDIDFNIRAGNTLVGFATEAQTEKAVTSRLDFENVWPDASMP